MPLKEEKKLVRKIEREYRKKGFSIARSRYIANATVFGKGLIKSHHSIMHPKYKHQKKSVI
jgi:hypothetical protein